MFKKVSLTTLLASVAIGLLPHAAMAQKADSSGRHRSSLSAMGQSVLVWAWSAPTSLSDADFAAIESLVLESGGANGDRAKSIREEWEAHVAASKERRRANEDRVWKMAEHISELERADRSDPELEREVMKAIAIVADLDTSSVYQIGEFIDSATAGLPDGTLTSVRLLKNDLMLQAFLNMPSRKGAVPYGGSEIDLLQLVAEVEPEWRRNDCAVEVLDGYLKEVVPLRQQLLPLVLKWRALNLLPRDDEARRRRCVSAGSEPCLPLTQQTREVTSRALSALSQCLEADRSDRLIAEFDARAYPMSFPDRDDAIAVAMGVQRHLQSASVPGGDPDSIRSTIDDYLAKRAGLNDKLRQVEIDGQSFVFVLQGLNPDELGIKRNDLVGERKALHDRFIEQMQVAVGDDVVNTARRSAGGT